MFLVGSRGVTVRTVRTVRKALDSGPQGSLTVRKLHVLIDTESFSMLYSSSRGVALTSAQFVQFPQSARKSLRSVNSMSLSTLNISLLCS